MLADSPPPPELTIVVVSYNVRPLLLACLRSIEAALARTPGLRAAVVVVDNASADGSPAAVAAEFPAVELRALDRNLGFGGGSNVVLRELRSPFALVLNPDTELRGDAPAALVRFMRQHPAAGVVGGRLVYPNGAFQHSCFTFPTLAMASIEFFPINHRLVDSRLNGRYPRRQYDRAFQVGHPLGAAMLLRRAAVEQAGIFDETFFMYCEEIDLCRRIADAGWEIWYTPDATIVHHAGASTRQTRGRMFVELYRSRYRLFARHRSRAFTAAARAIFGVGLLRDLARAALDRQRGRISAHEWHTYRAITAATLRLR